MERVTLLSPLLCTAASQLCHMGFTLNLLSSKSGRILGGKKEIYQLYHLGSVKSRWKLNVKCLIHFPAMAARGTSPILCQTEV